MTLSALASNSVDNLQSQSGGLWQSLHTKHRSIRGMFLRFAHCDLLRSSKSSRVLSWCSKTGSAGPEPETLANHPKGTL